MTEAMLFVVVCTFSAIWTETGTRLSANTDTIADLDVTLSFRSDSDGFADNLVADTARIERLAPAGMKSVDVRPAHTTMSDLGTATSELELHQMACA